MSEQAKNTPGETRRKLLLQQTENGLWAESAEYIADRYYEEMGLDPV